METNVQTKYSKKSTSVEGENREVEAYYNRLQAESDRLDAEARANANKRSNAYNVGYAACLQGEDRTVCTYASDTMSFNEWNRGWETANESTPRDY